MSTKQYSTDSSVSADSDADLSSLANESRPASPALSFSSKIHYYIVPNAVDPHDSPLESPTCSPSPPPAWKKHDRLYFGDGNVTFCVKDTLYSVHRHFFQEHSDDLASVYGLHDGPESFIHLEDVEIQDFDRFLSIFYPSTYAPPYPETKTVEQWTSVLRLATKWKFLSIRELAVDRLFAITSPVEKIVLARSFELPQWLPVAYEALCSREEPLSIQEGRDLFSLGEAGCDVVILLNQARQRWRPRQINSVRNITDVVKQIVFQLDPPCVPGNDGLPELLGNPDAAWAINEDKSNNDLFPHFGGELEAQPSTPRVIAKKKKAPITVRR